MREFYWPAWHAVLARVLKTAEPGTDPREISAAVDEQTHWIAGPPPTNCGKLSDYLGNA
jgi:hypothetical protein